MNVFNIIIINSGRNEYNGNIIIEEDGTFYGIGFEKNYDTKVDIAGKIESNKIHLNIISQSSVISTIANIENYFSKNSVAPSKYFVGKSIDRYDDTLFIEITSIKEIEKILLNEKPKILSKQKVPQ